MKVLVLCDDYWHPAKVVRAGLQALPGQDFEFTVIEDACDWSPERMDGYPLTMLVKSDDVSAEKRTPWLTEEVQRSFADYVRAGHGLLAVHSGTVASRAVPGLKDLLGGQFSQHPEQCPVTVTPVEGHPLAEGAKTFTLKDEHYFMDMSGAPVDVFLTSTSEHGTQPAGWTRTEGQGRVCVLTPGHNVEVWLEPSFQALLKNALRWCAVR